MPRRNSRRWLNKTTTMETHHSPKETLPPIPAKRYFTIGEVSELCGVKPHVLRYWEQEFTQLKPVNSCTTKCCSSAASATCSTSRASPSAAPATGWTRAGTAHRQG